MLNQQLTKSRTTDAMRAAVKKACNESLGPTDPPFNEAILTIKQILMENEDM
jgi:hypothetical protein